MVAVAVGLESGKIRDVVQAAGFAAHLEVALAQAVGAEERRGVECRPRRAIGGEHLHDTARGVAVETREGAAQHLDAVGGGEVEGRGLALTIGHRRWNAVGDEAHAAHSERGSAAEAARRDLQVLGVVLAVLNHDSGNAVERLGEIHLGIVLADDARIHRVDGGWNVITRLGRARGCDDHRFLLRPCGCGGKSEKHCD